MCCLSNTDCNVTADGRLFDLGLHVHVFALGDGRYIGCWFALLHFDGGAATTGMVLWEWLLEGNGGTTACCEGLTARGDQQLLWLIDVRRHCHMHYLLSILTY